MPFCIVVPTGVRGVPLVGVLGNDVLQGALPPWVLATLAAWSCTALSLKCLTCDNEVFSHARAPRRSALIVMTPFGPGIFMVA
jgi:hypothetical protein